TRSQSDLLLHHQSIWSGSTDGRRCAAPHIPTGRRDHERNHETDTADVIRGNFGEPWPAISGDSGSPAGTPPIHRPGVGLVSVEKRENPFAGAELRSSPVDGTG